MSAEADVKLNDFKNIFSLEGKVAVVTGGSRGLGLHAASGYDMLNLEQWNQPLTNTQTSSSRRIQSLHHLAKGQSL